MSQSGTKICHATTAFFRPIQMPPPSEPTLPPCADDAAAPAFEDMETLVTQVLDQLQETADSAHALPGQSTGFPELDRRTHGLQAGDLVVLAGQPLIGKTAFALQLAEHVAARQGEPVAWFSLGTGGAHLARRLLGLLAGIDPARIAEARLLPAEWERLVQAVPALKRLPLQIDTTPGLSVDALHARIRQRFSGRQPPRLIVVDALQSLCPPAPQGGDAAPDMAVTAAGLKALAREWQGPVLVVTELPAGPLGKDLGSLMAALGDTPDLSWRADMILFLCPRDGARSPPRHRAAVDLVIARQHRGTTGSLPLWLDPSLLRFESAGAEQDTSGTCYP